MRLHRTAAIILGCLTAVGFGQSLGDVAREQQQEKATRSAGGTTSSRKVITNEDIPEESDPSPSNSPRNSSSSAIPPASNDVRAARRWKAAIQQQEQLIAEMQGDIDQRKATIHFVEANRYRNGVQYNQRQLEKQQEVEHMQKQLAEEKKRLEQMQEAARRAGLGNAVYDP